MNKYLLIILALAIFGVGTVVLGYSGDTPKVVVEGDYLEAPSNSLGGFYSPDITGEITRTLQVNQTVATSTVVLRTSDSGRTVLLKATGTIITLPRVEDGLEFKFQINGASAIDNFQIRSIEGDNIEGTLIVAGAVVDCAGEDKVNFITDGENIGDYFEIMSDGSQWLLGDSGVLTSAKLTCTDPA